MKLYMAGGVHGNLNPAWRRMTELTDAGFIKALQKEGFLSKKLFLAGVDRDNHRQVKEALSEDDMKMFLAGVAPWRNEGLYDQTIIGYRPYILESFFYVDADTERLLPYFGDFMLDSGAFSFCGTGGLDLKELDAYIERYADFINRNHVDKFFELDIDSIVGYEEVKKIRTKLERLTGKPSIPVWHFARGKDEFLRHCDEYPYVALGGYVAAIKKGDPRQKAYMASYPWFISEAHKRKTKIHGLGFTSLTMLPKMHFDSVDSTAWTTGNRFGYIYYFNGKTMQKKSAPKGHRLGDSRKVALNNYIEWLKFQRYANTHY